MAKITLTDLSSLANETTAIAAINDNNARLEQALENTVSRDGTSPNTMNSALDMNGYNIINVGTINTVGNTDVIANVKSYGAVGDGTTDDRQAFINAYTAAVANGIPLVIPTGNYKFSSDYTPAAANLVVHMYPGVEFNGTGKFKLNNLIPYQVTPGFAQELIYGSYDSSFSSYLNLMQNASIATANLATLPVVAQFGEGIANVASSQAWGGNFVGVSNFSGATGIGVEINSDAIVSGALAYGVVIASAGNFQSQAAIQIQSNTTSSKYINGIVFNNSGISCATGTYILGSSGTVTSGIDFSAVTFSGNAIATPGFTVGSTGNISLSSGNVINWNAGDILLTHSANKLTYTGASSGYVFDTSVGAGGVTPAINGFEAGFGGDTQLRLVANSAVDARFLASNGSTAVQAGSFSNHPVTIMQNSGIALNISTGKSVTSPSPTGGLGYSTGAGGTVTQATSKSTGVTLNTVCGAITMNAAALAAATIVSFTLTDSAIAATDVLVLNHISGGTPGSYTLNARAAAGSATIDVRNNTAGSLSEAIVIQFAVIKGVNA